MKKIILSLLVLSACAPVKRTLVLQSLPAETPMPCTVDPDPTWTRELRDDYFYTGCLSGIAETNKAHKAEKICGALLKELQENLNK